MTTYPVALIEGWANTMATVKSMNPLMRRSTGRRGASLRLPTPEASNLGAAVFF